MEERRAAYSKEAITTRWRLTRNDFRQISDEYHMWRDQQSTRKRETSERQMEVFLDFLAAGGFYRQTGFSMGIAKSTTFHHVHEVATFFHVRVLKRFLYSLHLKIVISSISYFPSQLQSIAPLHICLPSAAEFPNLGIPFVLLNGQLAFVILCIDGTIVRIQRPDHAGGAYFCG